MLKRMSVKVMESTVQIRMNLDHFIETTEDLASLLAARLDSALFASVT